MLLAEKRKLLAIRAERRTSPARRIIEANRRARRVGEPWPYDSSPVLCGFTASFRVFVFFFLEVGVFVRKAHRCWQPIGIPKDSMKTHIFHPVSKTVPFDDVPLVRFESENLTHQLWEKAERKIYAPV